MRLAHDYGTKPRILLVGNFEFAALIRESLAALGYGKAPGWGPYRTVPLLTLIFRDEQKGRECFNHFINWSGADQDGDAVGLGFIEFDTREYGLCVYPELGHLVKRLMPDHLESEVDPLITLPSHLKMFPERSQSYQWFKESTKSSPFLIAPGTLSGPLLDMAIKKNKVDYYTEHDIPDNSPVATLLSARSGTAPRLRLSRPKNTVPSPTEIAERRKKQLSRFFPVTLERMAARPDFAEATRLLLDAGYQLWQVQQATCNLVVLFRLENLKASSDTPQRDASRQPQGEQVMLLEYLLSTVETISSTMPPEGALSYERLRTQIHKDSAYLIEYVEAPRKPNIGADVLGQLEKRNLLV